MLIVSRKVGQGTLLRDRDTGRVIAVIRQLESRKGYEHRIGIEAGEEIRIDREETVGGLWAAPGPKPHVFEMGEEYPNRCNRCGLDLLDEVHVREAPNHKPKE